MTSTKVKLLSISLISALLLFLLAAFYNVEAAQKQDEQVLINYQAEVLGHLLHKDLNQQIKAVRHFQLYLASNNDIPLDKFNNFSKRIMGEFTYINNVEWGVNIPHQARGDFESLLQHIYKTPITITEKTVSGKIKLAPTHDRYLVIKYIYPFLGNHEAIGFDPSVGKGALNNLSLAINTQKPTLSGNIRLDQHYNKGSATDSIAIYIPIFSTQQTVLGFLTLILDVEKLLESILIDSQLDSLITSNIRLTDKTYSIPELLFETRSFNEKSAQSISSTTNIRIANRLWQLELKTTLENGPLFSSHFHNIVLLSGLILTLLTISFMLFLMRELTASEKRLDDKENELVDSQTASSLLTVTFEAHQAILITDVNGDILRVNKAFCEITGYSEPEVIGENPRILSSGRQSKKFYQNMWQQLNSFGKYSGEIWNRRKNGEVYPEMQTITAIKDRQGKVTHYVSLFTDITKQKQHEEKEKNLVLYDPLTLLPNRRLLMDRLDKQLAESKRYNALGALLTIDIDDFHGINKKFNYHNGDEVLIKLGSRLFNTLRNTDTVARIEGDEFAILIPVRAEQNDSISDQVLLVAEKLQQGLLSPFVIGSDIIHLKVSIGIALIHPKVDAGTTIMRQARSAMFKAKTMGKNNIVFEPINNTILMDE